MRLVLFSIYLQMHYRISDHQKRIFCFPLSVPVNVILTQQRKTRLPVAGGMKKDRLFQHSPCAFFCDLRFHTLVLLTTGQVHRNILSLVGTFTVETAKSTACWKIIC